MIDVASFLTFDEKTVHPIVHAYKADCKKMTLLTSGHMNFVTTPSNPYYLMLKWTYLQLKCV
jgi:hypothetical protein